MDPVLLYLVMSVTVAVWTGNYVATKVGQSDTIVDVGHALIPQIRLSPLVKVGVTFAWLPFLVLANARMAIVQRIGLRLLMLFALRAITNVVTILPKHEDCDTRFKWYMLFNGGCYDKVFSGHSALAALVSLAFVAYGVWPAWAGWSYTASMVLMLLVSRGHYTVDIVLGLALAFMAWSMPLPWNDT